MPTKIYKRKPLSEETKKKISEAHKGMIFTEEHKQRLSESHKGQIAWNKGKTGFLCSEETRRKLSETHKGKILSIETRKKISRANKGKHPTEETKRKMSESRRKEYLSEETIRRMSESHKNQHYSPSTEFKKGGNKGKNNYNWQGGKSFEEYTINFNKELKELIRRRDNYQCQLCGMLEIENIKKLCVHHIDYDKRNCLPSNLISLCQSCHTKTNHNRRYWIKYFLKIGT